MSKEKIISAAIKYEAYQPESDDIVDIIIMGVDHDHALESNIASCAEPLDDIEIGFMTNKQRFVTPQSAMIIAIERGQYPNYELRIKKGYEIIQEYEEMNELTLEEQGVSGLYDEDIAEVKSDIEKLQALHKRKKLLAEDINQ